MHYLFPEVQYYLLEKLFYLLMYNDFTQRMVVLKALEHFLQLLYYNYQHPLPLQYVHVYQYISNDYQILKYP